MNYLSQLIVWCFYCIACSRLFSSAVSHYCLLLLLLLVLVLVLLLYLCKENPFMKIYKNKTLGATCGFVVIEIYKLQRTLFTARCTIVHSAILRSHVVRLSVCPSVCPSVTLVDQDHIGSKSWKLIARTSSPTPSLFGAQRPSTYSQGNMGKFGGE